MWYSTGIKRLSNAARGQKDLCANRLQGAFIQRGFLFSGKAESIFMEGVYFCGTRLE